MLHTYEDAYCREMLEKEIKQLSQDIRAIQLEIETLISNEEEMKKRYALYLRMGGIGEGSAKLLLCGLPELGSSGLPSRTIPSPMSSNSFHTAF